jgi:hypothetical protein
MGFFRVVGVVKWARVVRVIGVVGVLGVVGVVMASGTSVPVSERSE